MVIAYLDIETYSPGIVPSFNDKIILISYKESGGTLIMLKAWDSDEKSMLLEFYDLLRDRLKTERTLTIIGFNILRFDLPMLACRLCFYDIDQLENILEIFRVIYWIDLRQCLLPFNNYRFKGLCGDGVAKKFGIEPPKYSNRIIKNFYEKKEYEKIEEHSLSDMKLLSNLTWNMRELENILKAFDLEV